MEEVEEVEVGVDGKQRKRRNREQGVKMAEEGRGAAAMGGTGIRIWNLLAREVAYREGGG